MNRWIAANRREFLHAQVWSHRRKDGKIILVEVASHCPEVIGRPARLALATDVTERVQATESLRASRDQLRDLANRLQSVREQERTHIARGLHDELGQAFTGLKMDLSWRRDRTKQPDGAPQTEAMLARIVILPENTPIPSGGLPEDTYIGTYDYVYDLAHQEPGSLTFYHSHNHGTVAEQYWGGMVRPMVVEAPTPLLEPYETLVLVLKDIALSGSSPAPHARMMDYMQGKEGDTVRVNGQVNPVLPIRPGQVQRWRILNGSNARFYKFSLEGHELQVIGTDGGLLDKAYPQSTIVLPPGERVDVLVQGSATQKNYRLLSLPYSRRGMINSAQITLMTLQCDGDAAEDAIPAAINPEARRMTMDVSRLPKKTFALSIMMGRGMSNGNDFDMIPDMQISRPGEYEVWEVTNDAMMDHPRHQHVNSAQVLEITGGDADYAALYTTTPARKDVTLVPRNGSVTLLVPVLDWPGMTMYHCHILEHEDIGMMGMWDTMPEMPMPYVMTDVVRALNAGAGIEEVPHADLARLNCEMGGASMDVVDSLDAVRIVGKVVGLEPNPRPAHEKIDPCEGGVVGRNGPPRPLLACAALALIG